MLRRSLLSTGVSHASSTYAARAWVAARLLLPTLIAGWHATPAFAEPSAKELAEQLAARDAELQRQRQVIDDLARRVQQLERKAAQGTKTSATGAPEGDAPASSATTAPQVARPGIADSPPAPTAPATASSLPPPAEQPAASQTAQAETTPKRAPGELEVDEEAAERALDRTLVATGALLIPFGQFEVAPSLIYTRRERDNIPLPQDPSLETSVTRNEVVGAIGLNLGLPWDSQIETTIPVTWVQQNTILDLGTQRISEDRSGTAFGDITVGVATTVLRESKYLPDLVGRVTYDSASGQTTVSQISTGFGYRSIRYGLTAVKRQDPLAFVAGVQYEQVVSPEQNIRPGNTFGFSMSALLASSPSTTLRLGFLTSFQDDAKISGRTIADSNSVSASLVIGTSTLLGRGLLLDISGGVGLTNSSPKFFLNASIPLRRGVPFLGN